MGEHPAAWQVPPSVDMSVHEGLRWVFLNQREPPRPPLWAGPSVSPSGRGAGIAGQARDPAAKAARGRAEHGRVRELRLHLSPQVRAHDPPDPGAGAQQPEPWGCRTRDTGAPSRAACPPLQVTNCPSTSVPCGHVTATGCTGRSCHSKRGPCTVTQASGTVPRAGGPGRAVIRYLWPLSSWVARQPRDSELSLRRGEALCYGAVWRSSPSEDAVVTEPLPGLG